MRTIIINTVFTCDLQTKPDCIRKKVFTYLHRDGIYEQAALDAETDGWVINYRKSGRKRDICPKCKVTLEDRDVNFVASEEFNILPLDEWFKIVPISKRLEHSLRGSRYDIMKITANDINPNELYYLNGIGDKSVKEFLKLRGH